MNLRDFFTGGTADSLAGGLLGFQQFDRLSDIGTEARTGAEALGARAQADTAFRPFTVSTGFGGVATTPEGGYTTTLSPEMAAQQQALQGITSGLLGGMGGMEPPRIAGGVQAPSAPYDLTVAERTGYSPASLLPVGYVPPSRGPDTSGRLGNVLAQQPSQAPTAPATGGFGAGIPDVSGITGQALGGVGGFLTGAMAPMAQREADVYERIRATQRPEEQRAQLALEERLAAQGRTGLRTAQFGGSPEQLALAQAQEEAKARASLGALEQAQAEQLQQAKLAESMFGLGGRAAGLPQALQAGQLGNIGTAMELQYLPEQQLLGTINPAVSIADLSGTAQRQGAGYLAEAGMAGLTSQIAAERARAEGLAGIYSALFGAGGQIGAAGAGAAAGGSGGGGGGFFANLFG